MIALGPLTCRPVGDTLRALTDQRGGLLGRQGLDLREGLPVLLSALSVVLGAVLGADASAGISVDHLAELLSRAHLLPCQFARLSPPPRHLLRGLDKSRIILRLAVCDFLHPAMRTLGGSRDRSPSLSHPAPG